MAIINIVSGRIVGKVGAYVGSTWKGLNTLRAYTKPSNPQTVAQIEQRKKWSQLTHFAAKINAPVLKKYSPSLPGMSPFNMFCKMNKDCFTEEGKLDYSKLEFLAGTVPAAEIKLNPSEENGALTSFSVGASKIMKKVVVVLYNENTQEFIFIEIEPKATEDVSASLPLGGIQKNENLHVYAVGILADGSVTQTLHA